jgi:hypothetical protein
MHQCFPYIVILLTPDTPQGDVKMIVAFEKINNKVTASIKDTFGNVLYKVTNTSVDKDMAVVTFIRSQSSDVPMKLWIIMAKLSRKDQIASGLF